MIKFKQQIKPRDKGADVLAVRIAMRKMGHTKLSKHGRIAGPKWVSVLRSIQRHHKLTVDGVYGPKTHKIIAPHMTAWARWLYRRTNLRKPPLPNWGAAAAAQKLLVYHTQGKYRDDSGRDLAQIQATAAGKPVYGALGYVHLNKQILNALIYLIEKGHTVGTFAICSDHHNDGPHGHSGGHAVDISSIDGVSVSSFNGRTTTLEAAILLHNAPGDLRPWQLICDGYGYQHDTAISAETIPSASFYGSATMSQHRNHIHYGANP